MKTEDLSTIRFFKLMSKSPTEIYKQWEQGSWGWYLWYNTKIWSFYIGIRSPKDIARPKNHNCDIVSSFMRNPDWKLIQGSGTEECCKGFEALIISIGEKKLGLTSRGTFSIQSHKMINKNHSPKWEEAAIQLYINGNYTPSFIRRKTNHN